MDSDTAMTMYKILLQQQHMNLKILREIRCSLKKYKQYNSTHIDVRTRQNLFILVVQIVVTLGERGRGDDLEGEQRTPGVLVMFYRLTLDIGLRLQG